MAPLLLVLVAESNFKQRRHELKKLEKSLRGNNSASEILEIYWNTRMRLKGQHFIEYLRGVAEDLDEDGKRAVGPEDIESAKDGLPDYRLFRTTLKALAEAKERAILQKVAREIASRVKNADSIPKESSGTIPQEYDSQLLVVSGAQLGKDLGNSQKLEVRKIFRDAVHNQPNSIVGVEQAALQEAADQIAEKVAQDRYAGGGGVFLGSYIPPEYDGQLLAISRARLGKNLTAKQREEVRKLLRG